MQSSRYSLRGTSRLPSSSRASRICRTRSRSHANSFRNSLIGRLSNDGSTTVYSLFPNDTGFVNGSANRYALPQVSPIPTPGGASTTAHQEDRGCLKTQVASSFSAVALASMPHSRTSLALVLDPLPRLSAERRGPLHSVDTGTGQNRRQQFGADEKSACPLSRLSRSALFPFPFLSPFSASYPPGTVHHLASNLRAPRA